GGANPAEMLAKNFPNAHQRAAAGQMPILIVDNLEPVHVKKHDAEWALGAARTVQLRFENADETAVVRQAREWISHRHGAYLFEKASLLQQRAGKQDDVAQRLAHLREKKRAVEKLPRKCRCCVAHDVERGHDKERVIEEAGVAFLLFGALEALEKTDRGDQEQRGGEQVPRTREQVRGV